MAEMYVRTEALKSGESFNLEDYEALAHVDWPTDSKKLYLVIVGNMEARNAAVKQSAVKYVPCGNCNFAIPSGSTACPHCCASDEDENG